MRSNESTAADMVAICRKLSIFTNSHAVAMWNNISKNADVDLEEAHYGYFALLPCEKNTVGLWHDQITVQDYVYHIRDVEPAFISDYGLFAIAAKYELTLVVFVIEEQLCMTTCYDGYSSTIHHVKFATTQGICKLSPVNGYWIKPCFTNRAGCG